MSDNINPKHYRRGTVECIDAISSAVIGLEGVDAMLVGNTMKYLWRFKDKNGVEDLRKAKWYLDRLIQEQDKRAHTTRVAPCRAHGAEGDTEYPEYGMAGRLGMHTSFGGTD